MERTIWTIASMQIDLITWVSCLISSIVWFTSIDSIGKLRNVRIHCPQSKLASDWNDIFGTKPKIFLSRRICYSNFQNETRARASQKDKLKPIDAWCVTYYIFVFIVHCNGWWPSNVKLHCWLTVVYYIVFHVVDDWRLSLIESLLWTMSFHLKTATKPFRHRFTSNELMIYECTYCTRHKPENCWICQSIESNDSDTNKGENSFQFHM